MICSTCKQLKDLTFVGRRKVTRKGLKSLWPDDQSTILNLKSLNWPFHSYMYQPPSISETGIIHLLKNMRSLEMIGYSRLARIIHKMHIGDLLDSSIGNVRKYNLTSIEINVKKNFGHNTEAFEQALDIVVELCPALKKLSLVGVADEKHLLAVTKFPNVVDLKITGCDDWSPDLDEVLRVTGKKLKVLFLDHIRVSVPSLLTSCPGLESLTLSWIASTDCLDHPNLKPLCSLNYLCLDAFDATAESLEVLLKCCPNLEELKFSYCILDEGYQDVEAVVGRYCELSECLQRLEFDDVLIGPEDFDLMRHIVTTCRPLKTLTLNCSDDSISLREIQALRDIARASLQIWFICETQPGDVIGSDLRTDKSGTFVSNYRFDEIDKGVDDSNYDTDDASSVTTTSSVDSDTDDASSVTTTSSTVDSDTDDAS